MGNGLPMGGVISQVKTAASNFAEGEWPSLWLTRAPEAAAVAKAGGTLSAGTALTKSRREILFKLAASLISRWRITVCGEPRSRRPLLWLLVRGTKTQNFAPEVERVAIDPK